MARPLLPYRSTLHHADEAAVRAHHPIAKAAKATCYASTEQALRAVRGLASKDPAPETILGLAGFPDERVLMACLESNALLFRDKVRIWGIAYCRAISELEATGVSWSPILDYLERRKVWPREEDARLAWADWRAMSPVPLPIEPPAYRDRETFIQRCLADLRALDDAEAWDGFLAMAESWAAVHGAMDAVAPLTEARLRQWMDANPVVAARAVDAPRLTRMPEMATWIRQWAVDVLADAAAARRQEDAAAAGRAVRAPGYVDRGGTRAEKQATLAVTDLGRIRDVRLTAADVERLVALLPGGDRRAFHGVEPDHLHLWVAIVTAQAFTPAQERAILDHVARTGAGARLVGETPGFSVAAYREAWELGDESERRFIECAYAADATLRQDPVLRACLISSRALEPLRRLASPLMDEATAAAAVKLPEYVQRDVLRRELVRRTPRRAAVPLLAVEDEDLRELFIAALMEPLPPDAPITMEAFSRDAIAVSEVRRDRALRR